jgi:hypothetical protein
MTIQIQDNQQIQRPIKPAPAEPYVSHTQMRQESVIIKSWTGGVRAGQWKAPWPFARLKVTFGQLMLTVMLQGELCFAKSDIDHFEIYRGLLPLIGRVSRGIGVIHNKPEYPKMIIFWYFGDVEKLATDLIKMGFGSKAVAAKLPFLLA